MMYVMVIIMLFLSACSTITQPELTDFSDKGVNDYGTAMIKFLDRGSGTSDIVSYGGAISLAGLSTGTVMAATARAPGAPGLAVGAAILSWVLSILKPTGHGNIMVGGISDILGAREKYFTDKTAAGISTVPTNCMTVFGGIFAGAIDRAMANALLRIQELAPKDPLPPSSETNKETNRTAGNTCGR